MPSGVGGDRTGPRPAPLIATTPARASSLYSEINIRPSGRTSRRSTAQPASGSARWCRTPAHSIRAKRCSSVSRARMSAWASVQVRDADPCGHSGAVRKAAEAQIDGQNVSLRQPQRRSESGAGRCRHQRSGPEQAYGQDGTGSPGQSTWNRSLSDSAPLKREAPPARVRVHLVHGLDSLGDHIVQWG